MGSVLADVQSPLQILNVLLIRGSEDAASDNATCTNTHSVEEFFRAKHPSSGKLFEHFNLVILEHRKNGCAGEG
jgi:hypothetical protein